MNKILASLLFAASVVAASAQQVIAPPAQTFNTVTAQTAHDEVLGTDGVCTSGSATFTSASASFSQSIVGKSIVANGCGASGADLITTIASVQSATSLTLAVNASTTAPWYTVGRALYSTASTLSASYVIGDVLTVSGGTQTAAGQFTIVSVGVGSATVNAAGSGGTNGSCTLTGTTGVTRTGGVTSNSVYTGGWFTATVTISGGAVSGAVTIVTSGDYSTPPTSLSAEPVTSNCNLTGATLTLKMAPHALKQTVAGRYTALPSNPVSTTGGTGSGAQLTLSSDQPGGYWAYGTDDTAAINAAISAVNAAGGGTVFLPGGRTLMLGAMLIPYVGTTNPTQNSIRITGAGEIANGQWQPVSNGGNPGIAPFGVTGTILDMRFSGDSGTHVAKIDTRGGGRLELDHFTLTDLGTDNFQFIQTTNTTLSIHDFMLSGNPTCWQMTCVQNGISFGGLTNASSTLNTNASTAGFQGYRTQIYNVQVENIQEAFQFGGAANAITFTNVNGGLSNGSYSLTSGFYTFYGAGSFGTTNNIITGSIIEAGGYPFSIVMKSLAGSNQSNAFYSVDIVDQNLGLPTIGGYSFDSNSKFNLVMATQQVAQLSPTFITQSGNTNTIWNTSSFSAGGQTGQPSMFPSNMQFPGKVSFNSLQQVYPFEAGGNSGASNFRFNGGNSGTGCGPIIRLSENYSDFGYLGSSSGINGGACNSIVRLQGNNELDLSYGSGAASIAITSTGVAISTAIAAPSLATSSSAQTGTLCWTTGTGNITVDTTTTCLLSSARFKHDIRPLHDALATTLALKPVSYEYNEMIKGEQVGFVAEDVAEVDDRLVSREPDGSPRAVRYQQLTAVLAGAIQQLKADNDNLRACQASWKCRLFGR